MGISIDWAFLRPWCLALGPHLSIQERASSLDGFKVQVHNFLGPRRPIDTALNRTATRLVVLQEAIELLSLALHTNREASDRYVLLEHWRDDVDWRKQLSRHLSDHWVPCFHLAFRASKNGDCHDALELVQQFGSKSWMNEPSDAYRAARTQILSRRGVEAGASNHAARISVRLQPPLKDTSNFRTSYLSAPSRVDTINYYEALYAAVKVSVPAKRVEGPRIDGLDLDLSSLETPCDVIQRLRDILALGIPVKRLVLQLAYSWDAFDQAKLVSILNSTKSACVEHLVIATTTCDNLEAALDSFPSIQNIRHVELEDRVLFGHPSSSFVAAFRRVLLTPKTWNPKRLTLRGAHFQAVEKNLPRSAISGGVGLQELAVHLPPSDVQAFVRVLPRFGSGLRSLEVHVTHERRSSCLSLGSLSQACPQLLDLRVHGVVIEDIHAVPALYEASNAAWTSIELQDVTINDTEALSTLARALGDRTSRLARNLVKLVCIQPSTVATNDVQAFDCALGRNSRLEYLALGPLDESARHQLAKFDGEPLTERRYAFVSAVYTPDQDAGQSALARIDCWNLAHIMRLADLTRRRRVVLS